MVLACVTAALAVAGLAQLGRDAGTPREAEAVASARPARTPTASARYDIEWRVGALPSKLAQEAAGPIDGHVALQVNVTRFGGSEDFRLDVHSVRTAQLRAGGRVAEISSDLARSSVIVQSEGWGKPPTLFFDPRSSETSRAVLRELVNSAPFVASRVNHAAGQELVQHGESGLLMRFLGERPLSGEGLLRMNDRLDVVRLPNPAPELLDDRDRRERVVAESNQEVMAAARRNALIERRGELTKELLVADLALLDLAPQLAESKERGTISAAAALLRLEPSSAEYLAEAVRSQGLGRQARHAVQDVLASAANAASQRAMLEVLDAAEDEEDHRRLVAPFGLLRSPEPSTREAIGKRFNAARPDSEQGRALAHALGSLVGSLPPTSDARTRWLSVIVDRLRTAPSDADRAALLAGLGNAAALEHVDVVLEHRTSESAVVRADVAYALRKLPIASARRAACQLLSDGSGDVAAGAVVSLSYGSLDADDLRCIADVVEETGVADPVGHDLIPLLARYAAEVQARRALSLLGASGGSRARRVQALDAGLTAETDAGNKLTAP